MNRLSVVARALRLRGGAAAAPKSAAAHNYAFVKPHAMAIPTTQAAPSQAASRAKLIYDTFFSTNARYVTVVLAATIVGEAAYTKFFDTWWRIHNSEVRVVSAF
jgi:hypothetical protein